MKLLSKAGDLLIAVSVITVIIGTVVFLFLLYYELGGPYLGTALTIGTLYVLIKSYFTDKFKRL